MKIYFELMERNEAARGFWPIYADVTCTCGKVQPLAAYRSNNSRCVKCGEKIEV